MKNLLLLGGGNCQRSAARYAASQGVTVTLVDYTLHPPAAQYAAAHIPVSTFDIEGCIQATRTSHADGIMTLGTDQPVYTAAYVSRQLGLPSLITPETALCVTNKQIMKQRMTQYGIPTVPYRFLQEGDTAAALEGLAGPYVIKPLDSQGQRGIFLLDSAEDVAAHIPQTLRFSRTNTVLVESFYPSDEVTVSAWVENGRVFMLTITDRLLYPDPKHIGVCIGHRFPSVHLHQHLQMQSICEQLCKACRIENGPLYVQLLIGSHGICVNELACRIGGAFEDFFIPYISGFDILDAVMRSALGEPVDCSTLHSYHVSKATRQVAAQLLFCRSGTIANITPEEELRSLPFVLDAGFNYQPGQTIPAMENATARFGHAVLVAQSKEEMQQCIQQFYQILRVTDASGKDMLTRLYPMI